MAMVPLLGEDGRGYELARRLDGCGAWRAWLGESGYSSFAHSLASPSAWEAFMRCDAKPRAQIHLQLRIRALLYDKASVSLFLRGSSSRTSSSTSLSNLNPTYLQLHGDDVYFSLEDEHHDGIQHHDGSGPLNSMQSKAQSRPAFGLGKVNEHCYERGSSVASRYNEPETENKTQRPRNDELPESWYSQCFEKYRTSRPQKFPFGEGDSHKRTGEGMYAYLKLVEIHKRKRKAFKDDQYTGITTSLWDSGSRINPTAISDMNNSIDDETCFFPEMMFPLNCVPDSALLSISASEENQKVDVYGVLDNIPPVICRSPAMIERFGVRPEYLRMGLGRNKYRGKDGPEGSQKLLTQEQASQMTQKVVARVLASVGIEGGTEVSMEVLSQIVSNHILKLGRNLKLLTDSYRKQFSSTELLKMFLQTVGFSNLGALADHLKDSNKVFSPQTLQHVRALQAPQQNHLLQAHQQQHRQMQPQVNTLHSQSLAFQQQQQQQQYLLHQQQWDKLRQRQSTTPRGPGMTMEKDRPMMEVKIENMVESSMDGTFSTLNKQPLQFRNQQMPIANHHAQSGHQFKQLASVQIPQHQPQSPFNMRTPPVKVEGFQELMGGDATSRHDSDERKLTSPTK